MSDAGTGFKRGLPTSSTFVFTVDQKQIGMFLEVSGLQVSVEVATYNEGGENGFVHQLPGRLTWPHIVLKRGVTDSDALFDWVNKTAKTGATPDDNKLSRSTGAITVLGTDGTELRAWQLADVIAVRWSGPRFTVSGNDALEEEIELAHHGFTSKTF